MTHQEWIERFPTARERAQLRIMRWYWLALTIAAVAPFPFLITAQLHGLHPERGTWTFTLAALAPMAVFFLTLIGCAFIWRFLSHKGEYVTLFVCTVLGVASSTARYEEDFFGDRLPMYAGWSVAVMLAVLAVSGVVILHVLPKPPRTDPVARKMRVRCVPMVPAVLALTGYAMTLAPPNIPMLWWVFGAACALNLIPSVLGIAFRAWVDNHRVNARSWMHTAIMVSAFVCVLPVTAMTHSGVYLTADFIDYPTWLTWSVVYVYAASIGMGAMFTGMSFLMGVTPEREIEVEDPEPIEAPTTERVLQPITQPAAVPAPVVHTESRPVTPQAPRRPSKAELQRRRKAAKKAESDALRLRREAAGTIPGEEATKSVMREVWEGTQCVYCTSDASTADHIRPVARGGWHHRLNLAPACGQCNTSKGARLLVEWAQERPDLVLHGVLTNPLVRAAYFAEVHEQTALYFRYPVSPPIVQAACVKYERTDLLTAERVVEMPLDRAPAQAGGLPFPPIRSHETHPDANVPVVRQWLAIGRRKARQTAVPRPTPDLLTVWDQWEPANAVTELHEVSRPQTELALAAPSIND